MFAFAIWDAERSRLFCARDRAGEKPFYYAVAGDRLYLRLRAEVAVGLARLPPRARLHGARGLPHLRLCPGSQEHLAGRGQASPGACADGRRWARTGRASASRRRTGISRSTPTRRLTTGVRLSATHSSTSAAEMSYADVPVGTFLSGGVDSSAVTAALAKSRVAGARVHDRLRRRRLRRAAVRARGRRSSMKRRTPSGRFARTTSSRSFATRSSGTTTSHSMTIRTCRPTTSAVQARESITVALTGDGGDELFGGYGKYSMLARRQGLERALSRPVTQLVAAGARSMLRAGDLRERLLRYEQGAEQLLLGTLTTGNRSEHAATDRAREARRDACRLRPDGRASSASGQGAAGRGRAGQLDALPRCQAHARRGHSHEARPCEHGRLARDAASLPQPASARSRRSHPAWSAWPTGQKPKKVLRAAMRQWLPSSILDRPKQGFAMPLGRWFRGDLQGLADSGGANDVLAELVDPRHTAAVAAAHRNGAPGRTSELHSLVFLRHWLEKWS